METLPSIEQLESECEITAVHSGGPGGQNVNKTATKIRIHHLPTGIVITCSETRSQVRNKQLALERLQERIRKRLTPTKKRTKTTKSYGERERELREKHHIKKIKKMREKPKIEREDL
jgi:protein subunit release factor B